MNENGVDRTRAVLIRGKSRTSDYVDAPPARRIEMVWELTEELWSISGKGNAQRRLQRDVAAFRKK
jgi:hypothetical protein